MYLLQTKVILCCFRWWKFHLKTWRLHRNERKAAAICGEQSPPLPPSPSEDQTSSERRFPANMETFHNVYVWHVGHEIESESQSGSQKFYVSLLLQPNWFPLRWLNSSGEKEKEVIPSVLTCLFMGCHDEMSPLLHSSGGADFSVRNVGGDEAQQALQKNLRTVINVILLRGQFWQLIL